MIIVPETKNEEGWFEITVPNNNDYDIYKSWCEENINEYKILVPIIGKYEGVYMPASFYNILVEDEKDVVAFKLRWL